MQSETNEMVNALNEMKGALSEILWVHSEIQNKFYDIPCNFCETKDTVDELPCNLFEIRSQTGVILMVWSKMPSHGLKTFNLSKMKNFELDKLAIYLAVKTGLTKQTPPWHDIN